jgi:hypothetical protein
LIVIYWFVTKCNPTSVRYVMFSSFLLLFLWMGVLPRCAESESTSSVILLFRVMSESELRG